MKTKTNISATIRRFLVSSLACASCLSMQTWAHPFTVNFDSFTPTGNLPGPAVPVASQLSNQLLGTAGVLFSSEAGQPYVAVVSLGVGTTSPPNGIGAVDNANVVSYTTPWRASFWIPSSPTTPAATDFVSVRNDIFFGGGTIKIEAFDVNGVLLGSDTTVDNHAATLQVNAPGIHFARISSTDNNVAWDDFSFNDAFTAVPEPPVWGLAGMGAAILLFVTRASRKR